MWIFLLLILPLIFAAKNLLYNIFKKRLPVDGKAIFITGCDSGIGYKLAKHLDQLGFVVFAGCLCPNQQGAQQLREESSNRITIIDIDVTDDARVCHAVSLVKSFLPDKEKGLWAVINNAGVLVYGEFDWMTWNQVQKQVDVNLKGTMRVTKNFLPMIKKSKGRIITVTSVNGRVSYPGTSVYSATKFALEGFCDALRFELSKFGVKVVVVAPGDHANLTNIMQEHRQNMAEMWNSMNAKQKQNIGNYFERCNDRVMSTKGINRPSTMKILMEDFLDAIIADEPKARYLSAPLGFKIIFTILTSLPSTLSNRLVHFVFKRAFKFNK